MQITPSDENISANFVAVESDQNSNTVLRGFTADGQQMWQSTAQQASMFLPDAAGGILGFGSKLVSYDGLTGATAWQYTPPTIVASNPGGLDPRVNAVRSDNTVFTVQTVYLGGSTFESRLLGIQGGAVVFNYALPTFHSELHNDVDFCHDITINDQAPQVGPIMVGGDGSVYVEVAHGTSLGGYDCAGNYGQNDDMILSLLKVDPSGNTTQSNEQDAALCQWKITRLDRANQQAPDTLSGKHRLNDDRPAQ